MDLYTKTESLDQLHTTMFFFFSFFLHFNEPKLTLELLHLNSLNAYILSSIFKLRLIFALELIFPGEHKEKKDGGRRCSEQKASHSEVPLPRSLKATAVAHFKHHVTSCFNLPLRSSF